MYALLFVSVFVVYLPFVHGDVSWLDGGHLTGAAAELGVPHPTGFPLFVVCGHALSLLPVGSVAFKVALLSAAAIAGATTLILGIARQNGAKPWPAFIGALVFPLTFQVWINGQLAEVYALNAFMIALLAFLLWRRTPRLEAAFFVTGLGLGSHATFVGAAAIMWFVLFVSYRNRREFMRALPFAFVGALLIAYLPLAGGRESLTNWGGGAVSTVQGLWDHLTAAGIRDSFQTEMGAQSHLTFQVSTWMELAGGALFPVLLGLTLLSYGWILRRSVFVAMVAVLAFDMVFSTLINPMGQQDLQTGMPGALMLGVGTSLCGGLAEVNSDRFRRLASHLRMACLFVLCLLQGAHRFVDRPTDAVAGMHGRTVLNNMLPDATLFATGDNVPGQSLYLQSVEGLRRDSMVIVSQHVSDEAAMRYTYERAGREFPEDYSAVPREKSWQRLSRLVHETIKEHPVYWRLSIGQFDAHVRAYLTPGQFVHRMKRKADPARCPLPERQASLATNSRMERFQPLTFRSRRVFSEYSRLNALWCVLAGQALHGRSFAEKAVQLSPNSARALTLLGTLSVGSDPPKARVLLERARAMDPTYEQSGKMLNKYFGE